MDNDGTKKDPVNEPQRRSYRLRKQSGADDCNPTKPKRLRDSGPQLIQIGDSGSLVTTVGTKETITTQTVTGDILSDQDIEGTSSSTYFLSQAASGKSLEGSDNNAPRVEFMSDPDQWRCVDIEKWLTFLKEKCNLSQVDPKVFPKSGSELCALSEENFVDLAGSQDGLTLYKHLSWMKDQHFFNRHVHSSSQSLLTRRTKRPSSASSTCSTSSLAHSVQSAPASLSSAKSEHISSSDLNTNDYRRFLPDPSASGQIQLWQFLLELLDNPEGKEAAKRHANKDIIAWEGDPRKGEFRLIEPEEVAKQWGRRKNKKDMNYDKLSRALRYYYDKSILTKIPGKRYAYRLDFKALDLACQAQQNSTPSDTKPDELKNIMAPFLSLLPSSSTTSNPTPPPCKTPVTCQDSPFSEYQKSPASDVPSSEYIPNLIEATSLNTSLTSPPETVTYVEDLPLESPSSVESAYPELYLLSPPPPYSESFPIQSYGDLNTETYQTNVNPVQSTSFDSFDNQNFFGQFQYVHQRQWTSDDSLANEYFLSNPSDASLTSVSESQLTHMPSSASAPCVYQDLVNWSASGSNYSQTALSETSLLAPTTSHTIPPQRRYSQSDRQNPEMAGGIDSVIFNYPQSCQDTGLETPRSTSVPADMFNKTFDAFRKPSPK